MPLTPDEYRIRVPALAEQMQERFARIARDSADERTILDAAVRQPLVTTLEELRALFAEVREIVPPPCMQASYDDLRAAIDRYDEAAKYRLYGADLIARGEPLQGLQTWQRGLPLEAEAHPLTRSAAQKMQQARC